MSRLKLEDVPALSRIFFPAQAEAQLLDVTPSIELTLGANGYFAFGKKRDITGYQCSSFGYICNPDGSIRWLYPLRSKKPIFLRLYNASGWRGGLFNKAFKAAFKLGLGKLTTAGVLHVYHKNDALLAGLVELCPSGNFAIFTGTVGENRKAVTVFENDKGEIWFHKQALTAAAQKLVENEATVLSDLSQFRFNKIAFPKAEKLGPGILVSDVKPKLGYTSNDLQTVHFQALAELAGHTCEPLPLKTLPFWGEIIEHLNTIPTLPAKNDLDPQKLGRMVGLLHQLRNSINESQTLPTAIAHGDFTPWNMYLTPERLHVYDWELSERFPLLYDAFHFVFQSSILIKKLPFERIKSALQLMEGNEDIQALLKKHSADYKLLYRLYLLRNISYYLFKYKAQNPLHVQAHWLVEVWEQALIDTLRN